MTSSDARTIRSTGVLLARNPTVLSSHFSSRLRTLAPSVHVRLPMRDGDEAGSFIGALVAAIEALDRPDELKKNILALARGRAGYVWQTRSQAAVGQALIAALADTLAEAFTEEARQAWTIGYVQVAEAMLAATCNRLDLVA